MRTPYAIFLFLLLRIGAPAQTIAYSKFEKSDFDRLRFDDPRFKEDLELNGQKKSLDYFPRLARLVDAGELILPCRSGNHICLVRVGF